MGMRVRVELFEELVLLEEVSVLLKSLEIRDWVHLLVLINKGGEVKIFS
jgi:hypothetical protein